MLIIIVALKCEFKSWWRVILGFHPIYTFSEVSQHGAGGKVGKKWDRMSKSLPPLVSFPLQQHGLLCKPHFNNLRSTDEKVLW